MSRTNRVNRALGERHPDYAASLNNLAGLYEAMDRRPEEHPKALKGRLTEDPSDGIPRREGLIG
jgi:hypothetical protein